MRHRNRLDGKNFANPFTAALAASNDFTFPPKTGHLATTANCIPVLAKDKFAVPLLFAAPSSRGFPRPTMLKSSDSSTHSIQIRIGCFAASSTNSQVRNSRVTSAVLRHKYSDLRSTVPRPRNQHFGPPLPSASNSQRCRFSVPWL
jgi:hypothetical protein